MTDSQSRYIGKKFNCPSCQSSLKFSRPSSSMLYRCPSCRRKLRLQERQAAAEKDALVQQAIDALVDWQLPEKSYDYRTDPDLDRVVESHPGVLIFDQPWPARVGDIVLEAAEVICNPSDVNGAVLSRKELACGEFRRVTIYRTGQVEEMAVNGHWLKITPQEHKVGVLPRKVVRELNRLTSVKKFAARINSMKISRDSSDALVELYIDVAVAEST